MNISDTLAESYIQQFWPEKPEPMKHMIRMAYTAGYNGFRGQVAAMALQGLLSNPKYTPVEGTASFVAASAVSLADELISELNKRK